MNLLCTCSDALVSVAVPRRGHHLAQGPSSGGLTANAQLAPSPYPDIDAFISGICSQV